jgi:chemotaxis protein methyltransferase CheR
MSMFQDRVTETTVGRLPNTDLMQPAVFEKWRLYIYSICGIWFQDNKKYLLESRLQKRMNFLRIDSYDYYLEYVKSDLRGSGEKKYLYEAITINETFFFRNQPQIDAITGYVIPEIIASKKSAGRTKIKIWSAASSSGEEPYSIAISIKELLQHKFPAVDFEITGTDISQLVIDTARKGKYKEYSIRNTSPYFLKKYFISDGSSFTVSPDIRKMVNFNLLNLYDEQSMKTYFSYDIIVCANVLIYFDLKSKIKVVSQLTNSLNKGGYLFIGYSETLHNISRSYRIVSFPKTVGYKKE